MRIKQYDVCIADLNPRYGTKAGKTRPVVVLQTALIHKIHPSTIVCPITTNVQPEAENLRVHLNQGTAKLREECDIMIDQMRAIDNKRLIAKLGSLPEKTIDKIKDNIAIVFDL